MIDIYICVCLYESMSVCISVCMHVCRDISFFPLAYEDVYMCSHIPLHVICANVGAYICSAGPLLTQ